MKKEMLINVLQPEECRIAILEDGVLEELYVERTSHESYIGNIYKGRIVNIEPSIQAAFVDFGVGRNGFLHVSDVEPAYYRHLEQRRNGERDRGRDRDRGGDRDRGERGDRGGRRESGREWERTEAPRSRTPPPPIVIVAPPEPFEEDLGDFSPPEGMPLQEQVDAAVTSSAEVPSEEFVEEIQTEEILEEEIAEPTLETPEAVEETEVESEAEVEQPAVEVETPPVEEPTPTEETPTRGRRTRKTTTKRTSEAKTSRKSPTRRRTRKETARTEEATSEAVPENPSSDEEPPRPQLMDSAERRTDEDDAPGGPLEDDDLFFPRPARVEKKSKPELVPAPEPPAYVPPEPEPEEAEIIPPPRLERSSRSERGPRGQGRRERMSIERQLEEDLRAAELEGEAGAERLPEKFAAEFEDAPLEEEFERPVRREEPRRREDRREERRGEERRGEEQREDRRRRRPSTGGGGGGRPGAGRPKPLIQDIFKRGQEVLVQVIKEGMGTKGPTLSTYISIAGRYLVLMPGLNRVGVSRKIADEEQRRRLREIFNELKPPRGLGFIIRTAGIDKNKKELQGDLAYLSRLWQVVVRRIRKLKAPAEIYQESDMITRTIRDTFTADIDTIWVDEPTAFEHAQEFLQIVMPRYANRIKLYTGKEPLFHKYGIESEIDRIQLKKVPLPHGGSIVIEQTEALVAIDVNSGNYRSENQNAEETAYQMNLYAAKEIARQLRLRDLGGVIVNDFIDMREEKHRRAVEKAMRDAVKRDRARTKVLKISAFGIIEMTRQRIRPSLKRSVYEDCPHCNAVGHVKTCESMSIEVMRMIQLAAHRDNVDHIDIKVTASVANYLLNRKRKEISRLEEEGNIAVQIIGVPHAPPETLDFLCYDSNNNEVRLHPVEAQPRRPARR